MGCKKCSPWSGGNAVLVALFYYLLNLLAFTFEHDGFCLPVTDHDFYILYIDTQAPAVAESLETIYQALHACLERVYNGEVICMEEQWHGSA